MSRRLWLAGGLTALLGGCGFQLRRPPRLQLERVHLAGFSRHSGQAEELRRQLLASPGVRLVESAAQADLILEALLDRQQEVATSSTAAGQVRELSLRSLLRYRVRTPAGRELIAPTELALVRDMTFEESVSLAKAHEAQILFRAMQADIATQVLRRLAALDPAALAAAAPAVAASAAGAAASAPGAAASAP